MSADRLHASASAPKTPPPWRGGRTLRRRAGSGPTVGAHASRLSASLLHPNPLTRRNAPHQPWLVRRKAKFPRWTPLARRKCLGSWRRAVVGLHCARTQSAGRRYPQQGRSRRTGARATRTTAEEAANTQRGRGWRAGISVSSLQSCRERPPARHPA
jgi:hypothetical protein